MIWIIKVEGIDSLGVRELTYVVEADSEELALYRGSQLLDVKLLDEVKSVKALRGA